MRKVRILVLGVGGNVSQGIIKAIRASKLETRVIGACIAPESLGLYMCDEAYLAPYASDDNFMQWLIEICNKLEIDIVLTGVEENICRIAANKELFCKLTKACFISSSYEKLLIGQNKFETCEWLRKNDCNYPTYCMLDNVEAVKALVREKGFPLIAKPCIGKSSKGVYLIKNQEELDGINCVDAYVLQECIGNENSEYTVGCYMNKYGQLESVIIMHRRLKNGTTIWAEVIDNEEIYDEAYRICERYKPTGPLNIQMRLDKHGRPVCFELNVRFSGTTAMRANFGFKDVEAMIKEYVLKQDIQDCFDIRKGEVYRYDNEMYVFQGATETIRQKKKIDDMGLYRVYVDTMEREK